MYRGCLQERDFGKWVRHCETGCCSDGRLAGDAACARRVDEESRSGKKNGECVNGKRDVAAIQAMRRAKDSVIEKSTREVRTCLRCLLQCVVQQCKDL